MIYVVAGRTSDSTRAVPSSSSSSSSPAAATTSLSPVTVGMMHVHLWLSFRWKCPKCQHCCYSCILYAMAFDALISAPCGLRGVVRIDPHRFLAGCRTRRLNQALSVLSSGFMECVCSALRRVILCCLSVLSLGCSCYRLSVQVIDWKDSSPKWPIMCWWGR